MTETVPSSSISVLFRYRKLWVVGVSVLLLVMHVQSQLQDLGLSAYIMWDNHVGDPEVTAGAGGRSYTVSYKTERLPRKKQGGPIKANQKPKPMLKQNRTIHMQAPARRKTKENNLTAYLIDALQDLGWENHKPPEWLEDLCPEVVDHFSRFPSFRTLADNAAPFMTTDYAAQSVCTLKVAKVMVASLNSHLYLHAGSQLGAILHGQPIVWDDDVDAIMDYGRKDDLLAMCGKGTGGISVRHDVKLHCSMDWNSVKIWLQPDDAKKMTPTGFDHFSPFVDVFMFNITNEDGEERLREVLLKKRYNPNSTKWFPVKNFFPTQPYFFGGIYILGPQASVANKRYKYDICLTPQWNHRLEVPVKWSFYGKLLDCGLLKKKFPFQPNPPASNFVTNGPHTQSLFPLQGTTINAITNTTAKQREEWYHQIDANGQDITNQELPKMNQVEVDNSISPHKKCTDRNLKVVEFNAERGRWWLEASSQIQVLKQADVVILNEMDIGMARSDLQHTTRQMAHFLGMNYAWGMEFVELTVGDMDDRKFVPDRLTNTEALHGNAMLAKCAIQDAIIFRNEIHEYFSSSKKKGTGLKSD